MLSKNTNFCQRKCGCWRLGEKVQDLYDTVASKNPLNEKKKKLGFIKFYKCKKSKNVVYSKRLKLRSQNKFKKTSQLHLE